MKTDNIEIVLDDIFNSQADAIVIPRSTTGTMQGNFTRGVREISNLDISGKLDYQHLGHLDIYEVERWQTVNNLKSRLYVLFATCVDNDTSTYPAIRQIVKEIAAFSHNHSDVDNIAMPIIGTGAGRLDHVKVCDIIIEEYRRLGSRKCQLRVCILEEVIYKRVTDHLEGSASQAKANLNSGISQDKSNDINETATDEFQKNGGRFTSSGFQYRDRNNVNPVLGVRELAIKMADILGSISVQEQGNMVGVFGRWGRGKSFFISELWKELKKNDKHNKVEFHAWKYQDTPAIWAYLYEKFSEAYFDDAPNSFLKAYRRVKLNFKRLGWAKFVAYLMYFMLALWFTFFVTIDEKINVLVKVMSSLGGAIVVFKIVYFYYSNSGTARKMFNSYYEKTSMSEHLGLQAEVQRELIYLLSAWSTKKNAKKIFLFVEDIDRCSEGKIIDIVDALRVMLEDPEISKRVLIIAAIDERILQNAIQLKYSSLFDSSKIKFDDNIDGLISEYFDKLFMLGLKLGDLTSQEREEYFFQLCKDDLPQNILDGRFAQEKEEVSSISELNSPSQASGVDNTKTKGDQHKSKAREIGTTEKSTNGDVETDANEKSTKLTSFELSVLKNAVANAYRLTPRKIRIIYYRYVLLKYVLDIEYARGGMENCWFENEMCTPMVDLLMFYSLPGKRKEINDCKNMNEEDCFKLVQNMNLEVPKHIEIGDYHLMFKALDIVIAY